jgi:predicted dehydrogenase
MVRVGVVGTSLWADSMYLPALTRHPLAEVVAICGRNPDRARDIAARWNVPKFYADYRQMLDAGGLDALVVATTNDSHHPITMAALDAGLHVMCEKPLALNHAQAREMADRAGATDLKNMVPFTYRYMPTSRYLKQLIDEGFIGRPYHLNMRYYADYGRDPKYQWVFDSDIAGAGVIADLGPHYFHLARWFYGEITGLNCYLAILVNRADAPDGRLYNRADDVAIVTVRFASGACGSLMVSTVDWEGTKFGQTQHMDFHGSHGTLYSTVDWDAVQAVRGVKAGETGGPKDLPIPDSIWNGARRDSVHNTYRDVFRQQDNMAREFITAIAEDKPVYPDFEEGARVQQLIDACVASARAGCCWIDV